MRIKLLALVLLLTGMAHGQVVVGNYSITYVSAAPSGACSQYAPLQFVVPSGHLWACQNGTWADITGAGAGGGTVTSVGLTGSGILFSSTPGAAVTTSGTLNVDSQLQTQAANCIVSGPTTGAAATPTCRAMVSADIPSSIALANGITATTQAAGDNSTKLATTAYADTADLQARQVPATLQYVGDGSDGAATNDSGNKAGIFYYTNWTVPNGNTVNLTGPTTIHATGTCTVAGTITTTTDGSASGMCGGASGGSGGGTAAGTAGLNAFFDFSQAAGSYGGTAGGSSGGNGSNASGLPTAVTGVTSGKVRECISSGEGVDYLFSGNAGRAGGSSGGARGVAGNGLTLICNKITGTDGVNVGVIRTAGGNGSPAAANTQGSASGGGAGPVIMSSIQAVTSWPAVFNEGGPGALSNAVAQPGALWTGDNCATPPKVSLTTSGGALTACTVQSAGTQCSGLSTIGTFTQVGTGGGTGGTITPTWQTATPTGTWTTTSLVLAVSSGTGIVLGMSVTGTGIPPNAYVTAISGTNITVNNYPTAPGTSAALTFTGGALQSCTATGGSGYQNNVTYTTSGNGGDGFNGWYIEFAAGARIH